MNPVAGSSERDGKASGAVNGGEFLEKPTQGGFCSVELVMRISSRNS
jgi:hypothetical protein